MQPVGSPSEMKKITSGCISKAAARPRSSPDDVFGRSPGSLGRPSTVDRVSEPIPFIDFCPQPFRYLRALWRIGVISGAVLVVLAIVTVVELLAA